MSSRFILIVFIVLNACVQVNGFPSCHENCQFSQTFDEPFIIPDRCNKTVEFSLNLCQVRIELDYTQRTLNVNFGSNYIGRQKRTISAVEPYDYVTETVTINGTQIDTSVFYSCTLGDRCEEEYLLQIAPKLIKKNYEDLQRGLLDLLESPTTSSLTCQQQFHDQAVECNGTCYSYRSQMIDPETYQPIFTTDSPSCSYKSMPSTILISSGKTPMGNQNIYGREFSYYCAKNICNTLETNERVQEIINKYYTSIYQE